MMMTVIVVPVIYMRIMIERLRVKITVCVLISHCFVFLTFSVSAVLLFYSPEKMLTWI
jgi:hypothetical protein